MFHTVVSAQRPLAAYDNIICDWPRLREQLLSQWNKITTDELEEAWPDRREIAFLVQDRYGIPAEMVENYLFNLERRLPAL